MHSSCLEEEAEVDAVVTVAVIAAVEEVEDQTRTVIPMPLAICAMEVHGLHSTEMLLLKNKRVLKQD